MFPEDFINPLRPRRLPIPQQQGIYDLSVNDLPTNPLLSPSIAESPLAPNPPSPAIGLANQAQLGEEYRRRVRAYSAGVPMEALGQAQESFDPKIAPMGGEQVTQNYSYSFPQANPLKTAEPVKPAPGARGLSPYVPPMLPQQQPQQPQAIGMGNVRQAEAQPPPLSPFVPPMSPAIAAPPLAPLPQSMPMGNMALPQQQAGLPIAEQQNVQGQMSWEPQVKGDTTALPQPYADVPLAIALDRVQLKRHMVSTYWGGNDEDLLNHELSTGKSLFALNFDIAKLFPNVPPEEIAQLTPQQLHEKAVSTLIMSPNGTVRIPLDKPSVDYSRNYIGQRIQSEVGQSIFPDQAQLSAEQAQPPLPPGFETMRDVAAGLERGMITPYLTRKAIEPVIERGMMRAGYPNLSATSPLDQANKQSLAYKGGRLLADIPVYGAATEAGGPVGAGIVSGINAAIDADGEDAGIRNASEALGLGETGQKIMQRMIPAITEFGKTTALFAAMGPIEKLLPIKGSSITNRIPGVKGRVAAGALDVAKAGVAFPAAQAAVNIPFNAAKSLAMGTPMDAPITKEEAIYGAVLGGGMKLLGKGMKLAPKLAEAMKESGVQGAIDTLKKSGRPMLVRSESGLAGRVFVEGNEVRFEQLNEKQTKALGEPIIWKDKNGKVISLDTGDITFPGLMNDKVFHETFGPNIRSDQARGWQAVFMKRMAGQNVPRGLITDEMIKSFEKGDYFPYEPGVAGANRAAGTEGRPGGPEQAPARQLPPAVFALPEKGKTTPSQYGAAAIEGTPIEAPKPPEPQAPGKLISEFMEKPKPAAPPPAFTPKFGPKPPPPKPIVPTKTPIETVGQSIAKSTSVESLEGQRKFIEQKVAEGAATPDQVKALDLINNRMEELSKGEPSVEPTKTEPAQSIAKGTTEATVQPSAGKPEVPALPVPVPTMPSGKTEAPSTGTGVTPTAPTPSKEPSAPPTAGAVSTSARVAETYKTETGRDMAPAKVKIVSDLVDQYNNVKEGPSAAMARARIRARLKGEIIQATRTTQEADKVAKAILPAFGAPPIKKEEEKPAERPASLLGESELKTFFGSGTEGGQYFDNLDEAVRASYDPQDLFYPNLPSNIKKSVEKIAAERYAVEKAREDKTFPPLLKAVADEFRAWGAGDQIHWKTDDQKQALEFYDQVKRVWKNNGYDLGAAIDSVYELFKPSKEAPDEDYLDILDRFDYAAKNAAEDLRIAAEDESLGPPKGEESEIPPGQLPTEPTAPPTRPLPVPDTESRGATSPVAGGGEGNVPQTQRAGEVSSQPKVEAAEGEPKVSGEAGAGLRGGRPAGVSGTAGEPKEEPPAVKQREEIVPGTRKLFDAIKDRIATNNKIKTPTELFGLYSQFIGGQVGADFLPQDAYNVVEAAANSYLLDTLPDIFKMEPQDALKELNRQFALQPFQRARDAAKVEKQQYSTPPPFAYLANYSLNPQAGEVAAEPSAGTAGLAAFLKASGADVQVNEMYDKDSTIQRADMLELLGFANVTRINAGQYNSRIGKALTDAGGKDVRPTAILMNPPFSRDVNKPEQRSLGTDVDHIESALLRLADGGRLVAIVGRGFDVPADWYNKYNVRANVGLSGKEYERYGTGFDNRLIVIDKTGLTQDKSKIVKGEDLSYSQALDILKGVRDDRTKPTGKMGGRTGDIRPSAGKPAGGATSGTGSGQAAGGNGPGVVPTPSRGATAGTGAGTVPKDKPGTATRPTGEGEADKSGAGPDQVSDAERRGTVGGLAGERSEGSGLEELETPQALEREEGTPFVKYKPPFKEKHPHPGDIVETVSMAGTPAPPIDPDELDLPEEIFNLWESGKISDLQFEFAARAHLRFKIELPNGDRAGIFTGAGTGIGKGTEILTVLYSEALQGRKKALWVSVNEDLIPQVQDDQNRMGIALPLKGLKSVPTGESIGDKLNNGVIFASYKGISSGGSQQEGGKSRFQQLEEWLGDEPVIIFDEVHKAKNFFYKEGDEGEASDTAIAVNDLHRKFPNARILYASATGASEVRHLAIMSRLGLWGLGTGFPTGFAAFEAEISRGGLGVMEQVARDMKAMGVYTSPRLSYKGAEFYETVHEVTPQQEKMYDFAAEAWAFLFRNIHKAFDHTNPSKRQRTRALANFGSAQQRFFGQLIASIKMPTLLDQIQKALDNDQSIVVSFVRTGDAQAGREAKRIRDEGGDLDDMDFTPRDILMKYIEKFFPQQEYEDYVDDDGNNRKRAMTHEDGSPVLNPVAVALAEEAQELALRLMSGDFSLPDNPMDQILRADFVLTEKDRSGKTVKRTVRGKEITAELTRRKSQFLPDPKTGKIGAFPRPNSKSEIKAFQAGTKRIGIFSGAAATGINAHASLRNPPEGQRRRYHILFELSFSADVNLQMAGRTLRSFQASAPIYDLLSSNIGGEKRFSATAAKRLADMGALTAGSREATGGGEIAKYNYESTEGKRALVMTYEHLESRISPRTMNHPLPDRFREALTNESETGTREFLGNHILYAMGNPQHGHSENLDRFFNRLMALPIRYQNPIFELFDENFKYTVQRAKEEGTFDLGQQEIKAETLDIGEPEVIYTDPTSGAVLKKYELNVGTKTYPVSWNRIGEYRGVPHPLYTDNAFYKTDNPNHPIVFAEETEPKAEKGKVTRRFKLRSPEDSWWKTVPAPTLEKWEKIADDRIQGNRQLYNERLAEAKRQWEEALANVPPLRYEKVYVLAGLLLPLWGKLSDAVSKAGGGALKTVTATDKESGESILGVEISKRALQPVLTELGLGFSEDFTKLTPEQIFTEVMENHSVVELENGLMLKPSKLYDNDAIEIKAIGDRPLGWDEGNLMRKTYGISPYLGSGTISRYFLPSKLAEAVPIIEKLLKAFPPKPVAKKKAEEPKKKAKKKEKELKPEIVTDEDIKKLIAELAKLPPMQVNEAFTSLAGPVLLKRAKQLGIKIPGIVAESAKASAAGSGLSRSASTIEVRSGGFLFVGGGKPGTATTAPQVAIGPGFKDEFLKKVGDLFTQTQAVARHFIGGNLLNLQHDLADEGYSQDIAFDAMERQLRYKSELPATLNDVNKEIKALEKSTRVVTKMSRKERDETLWLAAHGIRRFNSNGNPVWNRVGVVWDVINPDEIEDYLIGEGLQRSDVTLQELTDGRLRIFRKFGPDEAENLYAQAVTGDMNATYADLESGKIKARPELENALKEYDKIRQDSAAEFGIVPLPGYVHHYSDESTVVGYRKPLGKAVAAARKFSAGKLLRNKKVVQKFFESMRRMRIGLEKERLRNNYRADMIKIAGRRRVEDESRYTLVGGKEGSSKELGRGLVKLARRNDPILEEFGIDPEPLLQAGYVLQSAGIWMPNTLVRIMGEELGANDTMVGQYLSDNAPQIAVMYSAAQDVLDAFRIGLLAMPLSAVRDFATVAGVTHPIKIIEDIINDAFSFAYREDMLFTRSRHATLAYGRMLARGAKLMVGKRAPNYLRKEYLPDSLYMDPESVQGRTLLGRAFLTVAQKFAFLKTVVFDPMGKRLVSEGVITAEAELYLRSKGLRPFTKKYNEERAKYLADPPWEVLNKARRLTNEFAFGGDDLNTFIQRADKGILMKSLAPSFFKFFAKLMTFLVQRSPLQFVGSRFTHAWAAETNWRKIALTEEEKKKLWKKTRSDIIAGGGKPPIEPPQGPRSRFWGEWEDAQNKKKQAHAKANREEKSAMYGRFLSTILFGTGLGVASYYGIHAYRDKDESGKPLPYQYDTGQTIPISKDEQGYETRASLRGISPLPDILAAHEAITLQMPFSEWMMESSQPGPLYRPLQKALFDIYRPEDEGKSALDILASETESRIPGASWAKFLKQVFGSDEGKRKGRTIYGETLEQAQGIFKPKESEYPVSINPQTGKKRTFYENLPAPFNTKVLGALFQFGSPVKFKVIDTVAKEIASKPGAKPSLFDIDAARDINDRAQLGLDEEQLKKMRSFIQDRLTTTQQPGVFAAQSYIVAPDKRPLPEDIPFRNEIMELAKDYKRATSEKEKDQILSRSVPILRTDRGQVIADATKDFLKSLGKSEGESTTGAEAVKQKVTVAPDVAAHNYRVSSEAIRMIRKLEDESRYTSLSLAQRDEVQKRVKDLYSTYKVEGSADMPEWKQKSKLRTESNKFRGFQGSLQQYKINRIVQDVKAGR